MTTPGALTGTWSGVQSFGPTGTINRVLSITQNGDKITGIFGTSTVTLTR